jgi:hypothetical protein
MAGCGIIRHQQSDAYPFIPFGRYRFMLELIQFNASRAGFYQPESRIISD